jgi:hypothetical protein
MYRTQTIKARLTEVTNAMSNVASAVAAFRQESEGSAWPTCNSIAEVQTSLGVSLGALTRLGNMTVNDDANGRIVATVTAIDDAVDGSTIALVPSTNADSSITWSWTAERFPAEPSLQIKDHIYAKARKGQKTERQKLSRSNETLQVNWKKQSQQFEPS